MPRVSKTKAPVAATPTRATRSKVRAGSAELAEPVDAPTPRRSGRVTRSTSREAESQSQKSQSNHSSFVDQLPALAEEEEKQPSPRLDLPQPIEFAPIADASPYVTPQGYRHIASTYNSLHSPPTVKQSIEQPIVLEESVAIFQDDPIEVEQEEAVQAQIADEEAEEEEEAVRAQLADDAAHAGLSYSHPTPPSVKSLKRPASSLVGRDSTKRPHPERVNLDQASPSLIHSLDKTVLHSPLAAVSVNAVSSPISPFDYAKALSTPSPRLSRPLSSPALSHMERVLHSDAFLEELTDRQQAALLTDMRREIQRLRKVEADYLAASKQSQSQSPTKSSSQHSTRQEPSPEVPRTVGRQRDLRYHMSISQPAKEHLKAQRAAEAASAAAEKATQPEQLDQTLSRSSPPAVNDKRKSKTPQSKTPEAQTPQRSSQTSAPAETSAASPSWGLTSLFGSVKNIFSHRPILSPTKRLHEQPQEQSPEQHREHPGHVDQQQQPTPARATKQKRIISSSQHSPTPKPRSPAPPATPTPASDEDANYGQTPRTTRRPLRRPGSTLSPVKRNTPSKPKEVNADRRAEQLEQGAQKTADRKRIQEQVDKIEQERRRVEEEQRKRDVEEVAAQKTGTKRKVKVDTLAIIPSRAPGASTGTYGLVDGFFDYDSDSDEVEMEEDQIHLLSPVQEHPAKRQRLDENVFQPKAPAAQPSAVSPVKQTAAPPSAVPATPTPNYSQLTQQAIEKQRLQFSQHKPKQPSRLRNVERLSTGSTIAASSPQQPLITPLEDIQEISPVPQLPKTPPQKVYQWPAGVSMETPESWARIDLLYTPEMRAADHEYFTNGLIAAMAKAG